MNQELYPRVKVLVETSKKPNSLEKARNELGILYARYGMLEKAEEQFRALKGYTPALVNLGNLYILKKQYKQALTQFRSVLKTDPTNRICL